MMGEGAVTRKYFYICMRFRYTYPWKLDLSACAAGDRETESWGKKGR